MHCFVNFLIKSLGFGLFRIVLFKNSLIVYLLKNLKLTSRFQLSPLVFPELQAYQSTPAEFTKQVSTV